MSQLPWSKTPNVMQCFLGFFIYCFFADVENLFLLHFWATFFFICDFLFIYFHFFDNFKKSY